LVTLSPPLIVVVGMAREARIVESPGVTVIVGGGQSARLARDMERAMALGASGVVSFGLCGGLDPALKAGDIIVESDDRAWLRTLHSALSNARSGHLMGGDDMIASVAEKARLRGETGADAVDMETHIVTHQARRAGRSYAVIRAVSDPADHALPKAALAGLKADGEANILGVIGALARRPWDLPALLSTASGAARAFRTLETARAILGWTLGCPNVSDAYSAVSR